MKRNLLATFAIALLASFSALPAQDAPVKPERTTSITHGAYPQFADALALGRWARESQLELVRRMSQAQAAKDANQVARLQAQLTRMRLHVHRELARLRNA